MTGTSARLPLRPPSALPTLDEIRLAMREELARALASRDSGLLTTDQAAAEAGVQTRTIQAWVRAGKLRAQRRGRSIRIARQDLETCLSGDTTAAAAVLGSLSGQR